jgi:hypothetical protein
VYLLCKKCDVKKGCPCTEADADVLVLWILGVWVKPNERVMKCSWVKFKWEEAKFQQVE